MSCNQHDNIITVRMETDNNICRYTASQAHILFIGIRNDIRDHFLAGSNRDLQRYMSKSIKCLHLSRCPTYSVNALLDSLGQLPTAHRLDTRSDPAVSDCRGSSSFHEISRRAVIDGTACAPGSAALCIRSSGREIATEDRVCDRCSPW